LPKDDEIPPEEEERVLEGIARKIVDVDMEDFAPLLLGVTWPFVYIGGEMSRVFIGPYTVLLGKHESSFDKYVSILEKRMNILKLIKRVEELGEEKRAEEKRRKEEAKKSGTSKSGMLFGLWRRMKGSSE
jgi:hypothetical protein